MNFKNILNGKTKKEESLRTSDKDENFPQIPSLPMPSVFSPVPQFMNGLVSVPNQNTSVDEERINFLKSVKVEDIHNEFFLAHENLLKEAETIINAKENEEQLLYGKLYNLGFYRHKKARQGVEQEYQVKQNQSMHDAIMYYKQKYPLYKFITEEKITEICKKYALVIGTPDIFIGEIPKKKTMISSSN